MRAKLPFPPSPEHLSEARWLIDDVREQVKPYIHADKPAALAKAIAEIMVERDHWKALAEARLESANQQLKGRRAIECEAQYAHDLIIQQSTVFRQLGAEKAKLAERLNKLQTMWDHVAALARAANRRELL